jgi:hypothetical protein
VRRYFSRTTALLLAALFAAIAQASVAIRADVEDLTRACRTACVGTVIDHASTLDRAAGSVRTTYRVRVETTFVGETAKEVRVRIPGGTVGTVTQETIGAPRLEDGQRVVVFLGPDDGGARDVVGMAQGVFDVQTDPVTGVTTCRNSVEGLSLVDRAGAAVEASPLRLTLTDLAARVAAAQSKVETARNAARDALDRRLAEWRRSAERHMAMTRGKPGGAAE